MAGYTYTSYRLALQTLMASQDPDPAFDNILPSIIIYAEQRIYRELDLIYTVETDDSTVFAAGNRAITIPTSFVVVNGLNVLTPAGSTSGTGSRVPLVPVSRDVLDLLWPGNVAADYGIPTMFAMITQWDVIVGPPPDDTYALEVVGTYRPDPLSASNPTTFLSERLPDLFMAASMVMGSGYMRNFGEQANDPKMGTSWEAQFQLLKDSANKEELRKEFWSSSWTSLPNSPEAQPTRG